MKIILLSGGSGKRLWPLSNDQRSKQFIKILDDDRNGLESMVQRVWAQLGELDLQKDTYIATGEEQKSILQSQLNISDDKIITEPSHRDTFPAIALASTYLKSVDNIDEDEVIAVLPVDPYVETDFFCKVLSLGETISNKKSTLGLIGVTPTYASAKFGYIIPQKKNEKMVETFVEKPSEEEAAVLIANGAMWNAGVFVFTLRTMIEKLKEAQMPLSYSELAEKYDILPKISFDYEFVEKQENIEYEVYKGFWKDLGTWNTLTEEMGVYSIGTTEMIDCRNTHIVNESNIPVASIGIDNAVIAVGPEGILVSSKESSPRVKEINNDFFNSVRYIEEDWGNMKTLQERERYEITYYELNIGKSLTINLEKNQKIFKLSEEGTILNKSSSYVINGDNGKKINFIVITENFG